MSEDSEHLCADVLFKSLRQDFEKIPDHRQPGKIKFKLPDVMMAGFAMFSLKVPSLLQYLDEDRDEAIFQNVQRIYGIEKLPSDTQMRDILDPVDPKLILPSFRKIFSEIERDNGLEQFKVFDNYYLLSIDGTGYFSSNTIHCDCCQEKNSKSGKVTYSHAMLGAAIVCPGLKQVIPIAPEPIIKQDGESKNDCERNAAKRFLERFRQDHPNLPTIVIEDGLASNAPHLRELHMRNCRYILGVKEGDHSFLFNYVNGEEAKGNVQKIENTSSDGTITRFRFINNVPLNESNPDVKVNFLEYWQIKGNKTLHFSWVTDLEIKPENTEKIMLCGRARWKIENEEFNTLKNKGYHFEHNYGHGYKNLSVNLALLIMLAFLIDQAQEICCPLFKMVLLKIKRKKYLWERFRTFLYCFIIDSYKDLLGAVLNGIKPQLITGHWNTS